MDNGITFSKTMLKIIIPTVINNDFRVFPLSASLPKYGATNAPPIATMPNNPMVSA